MVHGNVIGSSDPKSCVEESEIGAKIGVEAEVEAEDITAGQTVTEEEIAAEDIRKAAERRCLRSECPRADLDIGDKESGKRHSSDNAPK